MSLSLDIEYVSIVCPRFPQFRKTKDRVWNFRCPLCGDSKKDLSAARGYVYPHRKNPCLMYHCHNCGNHQTFANFLKEIDEDSFKEYRIRAFKEKFGERSNNKIKEPVQAVIKPKTISTDVLSYLPTIAQLDDTHHCKQYVASRRIPLFQYDKMYYCDDFATLAMKIDKEVDGLRPNEERLVLPMIDEEGRLLGVIGRDLKPKSKLRYISIKVSSATDKVYGINRINKNEKVFVLEGAIDSMFINNAVASAGSGLTSVVLNGVPNENKVFVYDNEPRNKEITNMLLSTIKHGYNVVIFPSGICEKDINDMILNNIDVNTLLNENIYQGLEARAKFSSWQKFK